MAYFVFGKLSPNSLLLLFKHKFNYSIIKKWGLNLLFTSEGTSQNKTIHSAAEIEYHASGREHGAQPCHSTQALGPHVVHQATRSRQVPNKYLF